MSQLTPELVRLHADLNAIHADLLDIHKSLLDHERIRYERQNARIGSPNEFLHLALNDPWFAWLRQLSGLITQIDEFVSSKKSPDPREGHALIKLARTLLLPDENAGPFQKAYALALQESPEVASTHGHWKMTLQQLDRPR